MSMTKEIEQENTFRALRGEEITKVCVQCVHYHRQHGHDRCRREIHRGFHNVSGKVQDLGELHFCSIEREIETKYEHSVKAGKTCGSVGQFWEQRSTPWKPWYLRWMK